MLCRRYFRTVILLAGHICKTAERSAQIAISKRNLNTASRVTCSVDQKAKVTKSMADTNASTNRSLMTITSLEKKDGGCYASGGWKR